MWRHTLVAIKLTLVLTVLTGVVYPLAVTGIAQVAFNKQANGSRVKQDGKVIGSELISQSFSGPEYFHPRPSAALHPNPLNNKDANQQDRWASSGSNLGPTSRALADRVRKDVSRLLRENRTLSPGKIPVDMVTTSASGLDPDISPANAYAQVPRIAEVRGMKEDDLRRVVRSLLVQRQLGVLGEPRVNVLKLNLALDAAAAHPRR